MEKDVNKDQLIQTLKQFVETQFWPRHRGLDEPCLLMLREPDGAWEEAEIFLTSRDEGARRNQILTSAMRQLVAQERPYATSVVAEMRHATDDPHAHYDHVMATLELRDHNDQPAVLFWKLGLDDCALTFSDVGAVKMETLSNLYSGADDCVEHWVYARNAEGGLILLVQGGSFRARPMSVKAIKLQTYAWLCGQARRKLDKKKVLKSLVVSYRPLSLKIAASRRCVR